MIHRENNSETLKTPQHRSIQSKHINQYWPDYKFQENNVGQSIWYKVRCYWEHVEEDIGNMENMFGSHWELEGNTLGTKSNTHIPSPKTKTKTKKNWVYWVHVACIGSLTDILQLCSSLLFWPSLIPTPS